MSRDWLALPLGDHLLAECPRWDAGQRRLSWVDVMAGLVCSASTTENGWTGPTRHKVAALVTAAVPDTAGGWWVATGSELVSVGADGARRGEPITVAPAYPAVRTNDMVSAADGSLLVGLLAEDRVTPIGGVIHVDPATRAVHPVITGMVTTNGIGFSPDGRTLYAVDTSRGTLTRYGYDSATSTATDPHVLVAEPSPGRLDGLAVDATGQIWVAVWDYGEVRRYDALGALRETLTLPVSRPSAVALINVAGDDGTDLLIATTARTELGAPARELHPSPEGRLYAYPIPRGGG